MSKKGAGYKKDINKLVKKLRKAGYSVVKNRKGHWVCRTAAGEYVQNFSSTPSCPFALKKIKADLIRAGVPIDVVSLETAPNDYSFILDYFTEPDFKEFIQVINEETGEPYKRVRDADDESLPKLGSLISLSTDHPNIDKSWKGTPPAVVMGWLWIDDDEFPLEGGYLYVKLLWDGGNIYLPAFQGVFSINVLGAVD